MAQAVLHGRRPRPAHVRAAAGAAQQLTAAIALNTLGGRITMLFGPALAGLIAAAWGLQTCYVIDTVSFVASLYATARLPAMRTKNPENPRARPSPVPRGPVPRGPVPRDRPCARPPRACGSSAVGP